MMRVMYGLDWIFPLLCYVSINDLINGIYNISLLIHIDHHFQDRIEILHELRVLMTRIMLRKNGLTEILDYVIVDLRYKAIVKQIYFYQKKC